MAELEYIKQIVTDKSITVYWNYHHNTTYYIFLNKKEIGKTTKTHFTFKNLTPSEIYNIRVKTDTGIESEMEVETLSSKKRIDVTQAPYYAVGDGCTLNTKVLQQAIDDCGENQVVYIPKGIFMTGALRLHSNMELYVEKDAVLQGTDKVEDYLPKILSRFEGTQMYCYSSLLNMGDLNHDDGYNCQNIVIRGEGTISSGGKTLAKRITALERERLKDYIDELGDKIKEYEKPDTIPARVRPRLINMSNCQNILLSGLTFKDGASWNVHMIYSDSIVTHGCSFYSEGVWNGDGWDPDSSTNCTIFNCMFHTEDDSIAIKSGKNPEGNIINRPCEHIYIFDCHAEYGHGITIGSEMSGGVNDVQIWDCDMTSTLSGLEIKGTKKRGGYVRNVNVHDCCISRIMFHSVGYNDDGVGAPKPPVFEDCTFENLCIGGVYYSPEKEWIDCDAIELIGFDEPGHMIKNIIFSDITIGNKKHSKKQTIALQYCENITLKNIRILN